MGFTESILWLIDAEDKATAKIRLSAEEVKKLEQEVRAAGDASELAASQMAELAGILGGSEVGNFANQLEGLNHKIVNFNLKTKAGGLGALAFKAGLVGATAAIALGLDKALGDVIWQTEKFNKMLADATARAEKLQGGLLTLDAKKQQMQSDKLELIADPTEQAKRVSEALEEAKKQRQEFYKSNVTNKEKQLEQMNLEWLGYHSKNHKANMAAVEADIAANKERHKQMIKHAEELGTITKERAESDKKAAGAKAESDQAANARKLADMYMEAGKKAQEIRDDEIAAQEKIDDLKQSTLDKLKLEAVAMEQGAEAARAMELEMQGIDKSSAKQLAHLEAQTEEAKKKKEVSKKAGDLTTSDERLLSGKGQSAGNKLFAETKKAADEAPKQTKLLEEIKTGIADLAAAPGNEFLEVG